MKLIQDKYRLNEPEKEDWDRLSHWIKRTMVHNIADKIYEDGLITFSQEDDGENGQLRAEFFVASRKEMRRIHFVIERLKCSDHREDAQWLEDIITNKND